MLGGMRVNPSEDESSQKKMNDEEKERIQE